MTRRARFMIVSILFECVAYVKPKVAIAYSYTGTKSDLYTNIIVDSGIWCLNLVKKLTNLFNFVHKEFIWVSKCKLWSILTPNNFKLLTLLISFVPFLTVKLTYFLVDPLSWTETCHYWVPVYYWFILLISSLILNWSSVSIFTVIIRVRSSAYNTTWLLSSKSVKSFT